MATLRYQTDISTFVYVIILKKWQRWFMNTVEIRQQIQEYVDQLSPERLLVAADFLAYLADREDNDATEDLLKIPGFKEDFDKAKENVKEGKVISIEQLKRKY